MEHDSRLFGIHKSVWQDWPCILRAVGSACGVKHIPSSGIREGLQKDTKNGERHLEVEIFNHLLMSGQWLIVSRVTLWLE